MTSFGNLIAGAVAFGISANDTSAAVSVPQAVYITFFVLMMISLGVAFTLTRPENIRRSDGHPLALFDPEPFWQEITGICGLLKEGRTWLLVPALLACEIALVLQPSYSGIAL